MASFFVYDSINQYRSDSAITAGTYSGNVFTESTGVITNYERAKDQNIGTVMTGMADGEAVMITVADVDPFANAVAVHFAGADGVTANDDELTLHTGRVFSAMSSQVVTFGSTDNNWKVGTFTNVADRIRFSLEFNESITNVSEIMFGTKLDFEVEPDINIQSSINYNNEINTSLGGVEYAINVNPGQEVFTISFQNISNTFKTDLITMQDALLGESKKFLWYDSTNYHWVRLAKPMTFTEVADDRFSTQLTLRQQVQ
ncbi:MAG: hypothetical protein VW904_03105 [bacterium]